MFGLSWAEMLVIAIVTLVLVGPQDIPKVIKAISQAFNMAQKMAAEFKMHVAELAREVDVHELSKDLDKHLELPKLDIEKRITDTVDSDHQIRSSFSPDYQNDRFEEKVPTNQKDLALVEEKVPERRREMWEEPENIVLLEKVPSLLPPRIALRLAEEQKEWLRPSVIPPMVALHDGRRAVVAAEIGARE
ncbi:hypothetical protein FAI40_09310 [Acetobacteraceae bacterium]|nr:hypothetical protein FAI40_09310 [Acetobacteraceae bacterium]